MKPRSRFTSIVRVPFPSSWRSHSARVRVHETERGDDAVGRDARSRRYSVDLAKVDLEDSEMDVLEGVDEEDRLRRQLIIEVHDVGGRLERIRKLLETRGFDVVVEQEDWPTLRMLDLPNVYAIRP
jgi:Methyltransferase FkbM domain